MQYEIENRIIFQKILGGSRVSKAYQKKAIVYGNKIEVYEFQKCQVSFTNKRIYYQRKKDGIRSKASVNRARNTLFRLVESNIRAHGKYKPVFVTLTYSDNISQLRECNKNFKNFLKRLNYMIANGSGESLKYVAVPEWQKRGAVHYHIVFFNLPYIDKFLLEDTWGHGTTNIQVVKKIRSMGAYLAKYFSKACHDSRLYGQKAYMCSRGLKRPIDIYGGQEVDEVVANATIKQRKEENFDSYKLIKITCKHNKLEQ
jgi:hypothetical protein